MKIIVLKIRDRSCESQTTNLYVHLSEILRVKHGEILTFQKTLDQCSRHIAVSVLLQHFLLQTITFPAQTNLR